MRRYRSRIANGPGELSVDEHWRRFLAALDRTYYVSATLRVARKWDFIHNRLGFVGQRRDSLARDAVHPRATG